MKSLSKNSKETPKNGDDKVDNVSRARKVSKGSNIDATFGNAGFKLRTGYKPAGDQPQAIEKLIEGLKKGYRHQTLLGVTGSGKSVIGSTPVLIKERGKTALVSIASIIDKKLAENASHVQYIDDTELLESEHVYMKALSFDPETKKVEWKNIRQMTRHAAPDVLYKVRTSCGKEVVVTGNHNFYSISRDKRSFSLSETNEINVGDYLPTPLKIQEPESPISHIDLKKYIANPKNFYAHIRDINEISLSNKKILYAFGLYNKVYRASCSGDSMSLETCNQIRCILPYVQLDEEKGMRWKYGKYSLPFKLEVTNELMRLFGYFIAEGHASKGFITISSGDQEIINDFSDTLCSLGHPVVHRPETYDYQISSKLLTELFRGLFGSHAQKKQLPEFWPELSNEHLSQLLKAYFSSDGGVDGDEVTCVSASMDLISGLSYALLRFGITTRIRKRLIKVPNKDIRNTFWSLRISGQKNLMAFQQNIGFCLERKNAKLSVIIKPSCNTNVDVIPIDGEWLKSIRTALNVHQREIASDCNCERSYISMIESQARLPSRDIATKIFSSLHARALGSTLILKEIEEQRSLLNLFWSPIVSIEEVRGEKYVYDFSVEGNETFLAGHGGIFVHNTFTAANLIAQVQKPTLVIAHNKTLAAQLAQEYREFFPENEVHYFVSYYDYYQPEAYISHSDTYIEKEAQINEEIERLRHASTQALLTRKDVIIVASVSCIYGLGSPEEYQKVNMKIEKGMKADRNEFIRRLIGLYFTRTNADLTPGRFRAVGNTMEIMPVNERVMYRLTFSGAGSASKIEAVTLIDAVSRAIKGEPESFFLFPAKHFVTPEDERQRAVVDIKAELEAQLKRFAAAGKIIEAERLKRRTNYDLALIKEVGYCNGIENYSRHFSGKSPDEAPDTLLSYFPHKADGSPDFLTIVDESHVTIPQIGGMFAGDASRKKNLIDYGFRLPSAADNRPLKFDEFEARVGQLVYTSATPGKYEFEHSQQIVEQIIRPTGLIDPVLVVKPVTARGSSEKSGLASDKSAAYPGQIFDFIEEAEKVIKNDQRVIATTLTKKMAEDLTEFLKEKGIKTNYVHSDIMTLDRIQILTEFRRGKFDVLVGVNLLREGLDLPEVSLIGILDADKEGFLRSETALIQTIGRAARNVDGRVILYADNMTGSLERAMKETNRRREVQLAYNKKHGITPKTIAKKINDITEQIMSEHQKTVQNLLVLDAAQFNKDPKKMISMKEKQMNDAVKMLDFETAAILRDEVLAMKAMIEGTAKRAAKAKKDETKGIRAKKQSFE